MSVCPMASSANYSSQQVALSPIRNCFRASATLSSQGSLSTDAEGSSGSRWKFFKALGCLKLSLSRRRMSPAAMKTGGSRESVLSMLIWNANRDLNDQAAVVTQE